MTQTTALARPAAADAITSAVDQPDVTERDDDPVPTFAEPTAGAVQPGVQTGVQPGLYTPPGVQPVPYNALTAELADPEPAATSRPTRPG